MSKELEKKKRIVLVLGHNQEQETKKINPENYLLYRLITECSDSHFSEKEILVSVDIIEKISNNNF